MSTSQPGILAPVPKIARFLEYDLVPEASLDSVLDTLADLDWPGHLLIGFGHDVAALTQAVPGLHTLAPAVGPGVHVPATPTSVWVRITGADRGELVHAARHVDALLAPAFTRVHTTDAFMYGASRDLSGYEDGTENPEGEDAQQVAILTDAGPGLDGSSFVAAQKWVHNLATLDGMTEAAKDDMIGRRRTTNEEFDEAPESAHVKRAEQEAYTPHAHMVRRSMPWTDGSQEGLVFLAFGRSLDNFERVLHRMVGLDDGITDALFRFTTPVRSAAYWCPPLREGRLDLRALGRA